MYRLQLNFDVRGFTTAGFHVYPERALAKQEHDRGGGGTPLQEANRDVPLGGWGRIFTIGVTIMGSHFQ